MPRSALLETTAPAATVDLAGWTVAAHYGDPAGEVGAVHAGAGVIDRSERGRLTVAGPSRCAWLNNQLSQDTSRLAAGDGCRALLLTVKGRIGCDLRVWAGAARLWLDTAFDTADGLLDNLTRWKLYGDAIELAPARAGTCQIGVHGPRAAEIVAAVTGLPAGDLAWMHCLEQGERVVTRHDEFGEPGYDVIAPLDEGPALWAALRDRARPFGWQAAEILRVEAAEPRWGAELSPDHFPGEAELEEALSHTKGCYPGQEIVARMRDRGHPNKLLRALAIDGHKVPARGAHLLAPGQASPVGTVYSAVLSPTLGVRALAYVRRDCAEPGAILYAALTDGSPARAVVELRRRRT